MPLNDGATRRLLEIIEMQKTDGEPQPQQPQPQQPAPENGDRTLPLEAMNLEFGGDLISFGKG